jgi:Zn-dependent protease
MKRKLIVSILFAFSFVIVILSIQTSYSDSIGKSPRLASVKTQLCMVIDGSGSISSSNWTIIKQGIAKAINDTMPRDGSVELIIVQFGYSSSEGYAKTEIPPTVINSTNYSAVANQILEMTQSRGGTPMADGINHGWEKISGSPNFATATKQVINMATDGVPSRGNFQATSDLDGDEDIDALDDVIAAVNEAVNQGLDELDIEGINIDDEPRDWFKDWVVRPQPGILAPPFSKSGWVRVVADANEFANTMGQKLQIIIALEEVVWTPSSEGAVAGGVVTVAITSTIVAMSSALASPGTFVGSGFWSKIAEALPASLQNLLQSYGEEILASKTQKEIEAKEGSRLMITPAELLAFGLSAVTLTFCFSYASSSAITEILNVIPIALATAVIAELVYWLTMEVVARKMGIWSEYKVWPVGIIMLLVSALAFKSPFCVAGRAKFQSANPTKKSIGLTSLSGPLASLLLGGIFAILLNFGYEQMGSLGVMVCLTKSTFDLIPTPPMNGKEILSWSKAIWLMFFLASIALYCFFILSF